MLVPNGKHIHIQEVCTRDGLQMEREFVPTEDKIALINALSRVGVAKIEVTSFTSPKAIPMLADAEAVMRGIDRVPGVIYAALVPNVRGCERALSSGVGEINLVMSVSESHNRANLRMTRRQSLEQFREVMSVASGTPINASLSCAFGCPFEGRISDEQVLAWVGEFADLGITRVTLADTTGMGNPAQVEHLCRKVVAGWPELDITAHFHDTRGMGLANVLAAIEVGIVRFDASLAGLGGCPFAPGATGNVSTEDVVHMLGEMGYETGVDLEALLRLARELAGLLNHEVGGHVAKAGPSSRRYPLPAS